MGDTGTGSWGSRELGGYLRREQGRKEHEAMKTKTENATRPASVVDEMCWCGHLKSQHNPTIVPGHGSCAVRPCDCTKFTWKTNVYAK